MVDKLAAKNEEARAHHRVRARPESLGGRPSEQLALILEELRTTVVGANEAESEQSAADKNLDAAAEKNGKRTETAQAAEAACGPQPPPPGLRRVDNPIALPDDERQCPKCGANRRCVDHETTEVIDLVPAEVISACRSARGPGVRTLRRRTRAGPLGDKVVAGGAYGLRPVADLVVNKCWYGLPLNRQREMLTRLGLDMPISSMGDQIHWATEPLEPIYRHLIGKALTSTVLHIDATSLPVKDKDSPTGLTIGSLWGCRRRRERSRVPLHALGAQGGSGRERDRPETFLAARTGFVVADAAAVFDASFQREDLIEVGCNMHGRRYFVKALDAGDKRAAHLIAAFRALYDVEADARALDDDARLALRQSRSRPIYDELVRWCRTYRAHRAAKLAPRQGDRLPPKPSARADALPRRWASPHRQRHHRTPPSSPPPSVDGTTSSPDRMRARSEQPLRTRSARPATCSRSTPSPTWPTCSLRSPEASPSPRSGPSRPRRGRTVNKPDQERPGDYVTRRHESTRA
ncbi:MAG: transposase [Polyangiaceae bacterium]|nr:transposase [Polyangiaceae bacterium]